MLRGLWSQTERGTGNLKHSRGLAPDTIGAFPNRKATRTRLGWTITSLWDTALVQLSVSCLYLCLSPFGGSKSACFDVALCKKNVFITHDKIKLRRPMNYVLRLPSRVLSGVYLPYRTVPDLVGTQQYPTAAPMPCKEPLPATPIAAQHCDADSTTPARRIL